MRTLNPASFTRHGTPELYWKLNWLGRKKKTSQFRHANLQAVILCITKRKME